MQLPDKLRKRYSSFKEQLTGRAILPKLDLKPTLDPNTACLYSKTNHELIRN